MCKIKQDYGLNRQIHKQKLTRKWKLLTTQKMQRKCKLKQERGKKRNDGIEENCQCCCRRFNPMATNSKVSKRLSRSYENWERGLEGGKKNELIKRKNSSKYQVA